MVKLQRQVLIVDETPIARRVVRHIFQEMGWNAVEAEDIPDAIKKFHLVKPDIVIMGLVLGYKVESGIEVMQKLLTKDPKAKIIMTVGSAKKDDVRNAFIQGAKGVLVKPIDRQKLEELVNKIISEEK